MNGDIYSIFTIGTLNSFWELFIPAFLLMQKQEKRKYFYLRIVAVVALSLLLIFIPLFFVGPFLVNFFISFVLVIASLLFCYKASFINVLLIASSGFALQHLAWNCLFLIFEQVNVNATGIITLYITIHLSIYFIAYFILPKNWNERCFVQERYYILIIAVIILLLTYVISGLVPYLDEWRLLYHLYRIICCIVVLMLEFNFFEKRNLTEKNERLQSDKIILEKLIEKERKQYEFSQETIDMVNLKFHDLKKQISTLKKLENLDKSFALNELEKTVNIFDSIAKTDNEVLNVLLFEKSVYCEKHQIKFTFIIDGSSIDFMESADIIFLFGNAIDNAIESVNKIEDVNKRIIKLYVRRRNNIVSIHIENISMNKIIFKDGIPQSDKGDKSNHGFGIRSMMMIAEKYNGHLSMSIDDNIFSLDIIFPFIQKKSK